MGGIGFGRIVPRSGGGGGLPGGSWVPWDALVSNNPGVGDYTEISTACATEPAGAIIAVDNNPTTPYVEIADISPKAGQVIFGYQGLRDGGSVNIRMEDFRVLVANPDVIIEDIYFDWDNMSVAGNFMFEATGAGCIFNRLTLDMENSFAGLPIGNLGLLVSGGNNRFDKIDALFNIGSANQFRVSAYGNDFNELSISGGTGNCDIVDAGDNNFKNCSFSVDGIAMLETNTGGAIAYNNRFTSCTFNDTSGAINAFTQALDGSKFINCSFNGGATGGLLITSSGVSVDGCDVVASGTDGILVTGTYCNIDNCSLEAGTNSIRVLRPAQYVNITNITMRPGAAAAGDISLSGALDTSLSNIKLPSDDMDIAAFGGNPSENITLEAIYMNALSVAGATTDAVSSFGCFFPGGITDTSAAFQRGSRVHISSSTPAVTDDSSDGFIAGVSRWLHTTTGIFYDCITDAIGAALWVPQGAVAGKALWSVLVHPTAGWGDYTTISSACTAEPAGTIIGVAPGVITELAPISLKEGQTVIALGGLEGDDNTSVTVALANNIITMANDESKISGIYFTIAATTDKAFINMSGNNSVIEKCKFDFTGTLITQHRGLFINASDNCAVQDCEFINDPLTYRVIDMDAVTNSRVGRIKITAGDMDPSAVTEDMVDMTSCSNCIIEKIKISGITTEKAAAYAIHSTIGADTVPNIFRDLNISLQAGAGGAGALKIEGSGAVRVHPCTIDSFVVNTNANNGELALDDVSACMLTNCLMTTLEINGDNNKITNCRMATLNIGAATASNNTKLNNIEVTGTFTNAANADETQISSCEFGTFTDTGDSTARDMYTQETVIAGATVRGSRDYDNNGAVATVIMLLPATAVDGTRARFNVMTNQILRVTAAAGDSIRVGQLSSSIAGSTESITPYSSIELEAKDQGGAIQWIAQSVSFSWTVS